MTDHATLKYPHDRFNGYVQLTDDNGHAYVPEFTREQSVPLKYCGAYLKLARRLHDSRQ